MTLLEGLKQENITIEVLHQLPIFNILRNNYKVD